MDAKAEVMPAGSPTPTRSTTAPQMRDARPNDGRPATPGRLPVPRTSEDPMRRTDRYRLVMPYANRM